MDGIGGYAPAWIVASAAIVFALGGIHLVYTFFSDKFSPRDPELEARMKAVSPVLTRETTLWRAWVGFNASHSLGAMLFGTLYAYLGLRQPEMLMRSPFLLLLGLAFLGALVVLAKRYWFRVPLRGVASSTALYLVALVAHWA